MELEYNPFAYEIHEDPYPVYARLREEAPVYHHPALDFYAYSRHADVLSAIRDFETYTNTHGVSVEPSASSEAAQFAMSFLGLDPPRHTKMRALVSRKHISATSAVAVDDVKRWPGVVDARRDAGIVHVTAFDAESVVRRLLAGDDRLSNLEVKQATLAEAFTELTKEAA